MSHSSVTSWILAARPKTLPAAIVPVWAGCIVAERLTGSFSLKLAGVTVAGAIFIQIATNFFNDVLDARKGADTAARIGPKRATVSGLIGERQLTFAAVICLLLATGSGAVLFAERGWPIILIGIPSVFLAYGYTGGPFPLAYLGLGEVFVILFFGIIAVCGTIFVQTGLWPSEGVLVGLQVGLLSAVIIAVNNYRDVEEDRPVGKNTLAVRLGRPAVAGLIYAMTVAPAFLVVALEGASNWFLAALVVAMVFLEIERRLLRHDGVSPKLLGLSAIHLMIFVALMNFLGTLTF